MLSKNLLLSNMSTEVCSGIRTVDQVVILLIDALRPDFALPELTEYYSTGNECNTSTRRNVGFFQRRNKTLTYIEDKLKDTTHPSHGFFFLADTPTVTCQRMKAMMTGTVPAFFELKANLNTEAIETDSLLHQLRRRSILLGDDTWLNLFPDDDDETLWKYTHASPPYNISDFEINDNNVTKNMHSTLLLETLETAPSDYAKLIIGHYLGVDHVGHRHNADHPEMDRVLARIDAMLHKLTHFIRHQRKTSMRTLLLLFGDHGMTTSGDHGGDSFQEIETFLYAELFDGNNPSSSPSSPTVSAEAVAKSLRRRSELTEDRWADEIGEGSIKETSCRVMAGVPPQKLGVTQQTDLAATISVLLGVPIPFSSIGRVIPEIITLADPDADLNAVEACNWRQLMTYFNEAGVPVIDAWKNRSLSWRKRISMMSFFGRKTRNGMRQSGMFIGSSLFMASALSWFRNKDVLGVIRRERLMDTWALILFLFRAFAAFANSFILREDVEVLSLLQLLLLTALLATNKMRVAMFLFTLQVCLRAMVPLLYRSRLQMAHTVAMPSVLEQWVEANLVGKGWKFTGLFLCVLVFLCASSRTLDRLWVVAQSLLMVACYNHFPLHHIVPLISFVLTVFFRSGSGLRYMVFVLWASSLCGDKYSICAATALYGALLPSVVRATQHLPRFSQAVLLHLFSWVAFFAQGNQCLLSTIDFNATFVGNSTDHIFFGGVLVTVRTLNAFALAPMAVMHVYRAQRTHGWHICYLLVYLALVQSAFSSFNGYIQKTHLMLFSIFCPKLIFDLLAFLVTVIGYAIASCI
ncbi:ethanolamine phosphotransferase, putative [Trypanosoma cruzi marinkellei]|uniref:Ethanolamine phosphotransferase, putative n=1 Tax=Trypanosoma cruzi marinkellei TaxID=85056 RepID=K2NNJ7_TRYCR|nr:ethanolamine phosphotransferase, putative [Trypanosoma cruzi marinkellei]